MSHEKQLCPDCQGEMQPIKLIDGTGQFDQHKELRYAAGEAEIGWFLGRFPEAGTIGARMCASCGRIVLHAQPNS